MPPLSSTVVVPCYNNAPYLREALDSILSQTRAPLEVLVIDDGSTDDTEQVVSCVTDPRVRYVRQAHAGVSAARNRGLDLAAGDLVAFLDADDRWRPDFLAKQAALLDAAPQVGVVFADFVRFEQSTGHVMGNQFRFYPELDGTPRRLGPAPHSHYIEGDAFVHMVAYGDVPAFSSAMLYRRSAAAAVHFDPALRVCEDMAFYLRVLLHCNAAFCGEVLAEVRRHERNVTKQYPGFRCTSSQRFEPWVRMSRDQAGVRRIWTAWYGRSSMPCAYGWRTTTPRQLWRCTAKRSACPGGGGERRAPSRASYARGGAGVAPDAMGLAR